MHAFMQKIWVRSLGTCAKIDCGPRNLTVCDVAAGIVYFPYQFLIGQADLIDFEYRRKLLVPTPTSVSTTSSSSLETGVGAWITCSKVGCPFEVRSTTQFFTNFGIFFACLINDLCSSLVMCWWNLSKWFESVTWGFAWQPGIGQTFLKFLLLLFPLGLPLLPFPSVGQVMNGNFSFLH